MPADYWADKTDWLDALRRLALLSMYEPDLSAHDDDQPAAEERHSRGESVAKAGAPPRDPSDPFEMARQPEEQTEAIRKSMESGEEPRLDPDWHVPSILNEEASLLGYQFRQFLKADNAPERSPEVRSTIERRRWQFVRLIHEHLGEKYDAARRTEALLRDVERGVAGFVLYLRAFAYRTRAYSGGTVTHGGGPSLEEIPEKQRLASKLAPVALVYIANPVDSAPLEQVSASANANDGNLGLRVESGASWESDVRALIAASSFIIVYNPEMMPGLLTELHLIEQLGRLDDTFFFAADEASTALGQKDRCRPLDDAAIEHMRTSTTPRTLEYGALPPATCLWIGGERRPRLEREVEALSRWLQLLARHRSAHTADLELDASAYLISILVLLEDLDSLWPVLLARSELLRSLDPQQLKEAAPLAERYAEFGTQLRLACEDAPVNASRIERSAATLRAIAGSSASSWQAIRTRQGARLAEGSDGSCHTSSALARVCRASMRFAYPSGVKRSTQ